MADNDDVNLRRNRRRLDATADEWDRLDADVRAWIADQRAADVLAAAKGSRVRHGPRLQAIEEVLTGALVALKAGIDQLRRAAASAGAAPASTVTLASEGGAFNEQCGLHDQAVVWLRAFSEYYESKFRQRGGDPRIAELLGAADEVLWSCYRQPYEATGMPQPRPAPIAFVEASYSPLAWVSSMPLPSELQPDGAVRAAVPGLAQFVRGLPVSWVQLPPWCLDAPWWLVFVAHEVGHHVAHDLGRIKPFAAALAATARAAAERAFGRSQVVNDRLALWGGWYEEVFADGYSALMLGPWATRALAEILWAPPRKMLAAQGGYPPRAIRLELMARLTDRLFGTDADHPGRDALAERGLQHCIDAVTVAAAPSVDRGLVEDARIDEAIVEAVAQMMADPQGAGGPGAIRDLCPPDRGAANTAVEAWRGNLETGVVDMGMPQPPVATSRHIVAAGLSRWVEIVDDASDADPRQRLGPLASRLKRTLILNAPPGTRAGDVGTAGSSAGASLAETLLGAAAAGGDGDLNAGS